jgi:hypothetical protein
MITPAAGQGGEPIRPWQGRVLLRGGVGIAHADGPVGTLTLIAALSAAAQPRYLISNNHIIANTNAGRPGDLLYHPERRNGTAVAKLVQTIRLKFGTSAENFVDLAFGEISGDIEHSLDMVFRHIDRQAH